VDATRARRTKDRFRRAGYAGDRQRRFARRLGFDGRPQGLRERRDTGRSGRATKGEPNMAAICELSTAELAQVEGGYLVYHFTDVLVS
jgi:bacteriocin-like protein